LLQTRRNIREISVAALRDMIPALRPGYAVAAALEDGACDIDVAALHQGYLRQVRARGGTFALRSRTQRIERGAGRWRVEVSGGAVFHANVLVNAAGAWGDEVAAQAGLQPLGLVPKRRTAVLIDAAPFAVAEWPRLYDPRRGWYCKPEARTRLMVSPADATPTHPHDVQPDELDVALAIDHLQQALAIDVLRVERRWAGLRTFTLDAAFAIGAAEEDTRFFWFVGQGGDGILTSPAAGRLLADLVSERAPDWIPDAARILPALDPRRFAA